MLPGEGWTLFLVFFVVRVWTKKIKLRASAGSHVEVTCNRGAETQRRNEQALQPILSDGA